MDHERLKRLQTKYGAAKGGEIFTPELAAVGALFFRDGDKRKPPYADPTTFLGMPHLAWAPGKPKPDADIGIVGVPMDLGVTNRSGARLGPRAVRNVERIGPYEHALKRAPLLKAKIADLGDVPFASRFSLESSIADIEKYVAAAREISLRLIAIGGDHSISYPILRALGPELPHRDGTRGPVGMVHIDAHCDTGGVFEGSKFHHGGPFRQAVLDGVLDPQRVIQIGIRGGASYLWEFSHESGMTVLHVEDVARMGIEAVITKARAVVGEGPTYVSFDVDGLDPVYAPGTGTPEAGGLSAIDALMILRGLDGLDVIGGDVVEVAPQYDPTTNTAQVAAQVAFTILNLMVAAPSFARSGSD